MSISEGTHIIVQPFANCDGGGRPHLFLAEDGQHGLVTGADIPGDHSLFVLFKPGGPSRPISDRLPLGRCCRPDELGRIAPPA